MKYIFLLMAAGGVFAAQGCFGQSPKDPGARWMQDHLEAWGKRPLKQWVLPAAHDAGMYESGLVNSFAQTQDLSIYKQLNYGVRYFDLRPQWSRGELYMHHGPVLGPKLAEVLDDVRRYCRERHRELIILKFSHYDGFDEKVYDKLVAAIHERLERWLYTAPLKGRRLAEIPLADLLAKSCVVWPVCDGSYLPTHSSPGIWVYRDWEAADPEQGDLRVFDRYADTTDYPKMKSDQFAKFSRYDGRCQQRPDLACDLFLLSWTLTPATDVKGYSVLPNSKLQGDIAEMKVPNRFGRVPNLLYTDYVETARTLDLALAMNRAIEKATEATSK